MTGSEASDAIDDTGDGDAYIATQLTGGVAAACACSVIRHERRYPFEPAAPHSWSADGECIFSFVPCLAV